MFARLELEQHRQIVSDLPAFWGASADKALPFHLPFFPLFFSSFSLVLHNSDRQILAYLYGLRADNSAYVHLLATRQSHYRQGLGRALLQQWQQQLPAEIDSLYAYTLPHNRLGELFFQACGFSLEKKLQLGDQERWLYGKKTPARAAANVS